MTLLSQPFWELADIRGLGQAHAALLFASIDFTVALLYFHLELAFKYSHQGLFTWTPFPDHLRVCSRGDDSWSPSESTPLNYVNFLTRAL